MPCDTCPLAGRGLPCPAESPGLRGFPLPEWCGMHAADPGKWGPTVVRQAELDAGMQPGESSGNAPRFPWASPTGIGVVRMGLVAPVWRIGGGERWGLHLIRATSTPPFAWTGVAVESEGDWGFPGGDESLAPRVPLFQGRDAIGSLARNCDVLVFWGCPAARDLIGDAPCKTVIVSHGVCDFTRAAVAAAGRCTAAVAVSDPAVAPFAESQRPRVKVVRNAVEPTAPARTAAEARAAWGVPAGKRVLGWLGRISDEKRPGLFLRTLAELPEDWHGVVVGPYAERIVGEVDRLRLAGRLTVAGPTTRAADSLVGFDCLLVPSKEEGACLAALEGAALGVPVLMTPTGVALEFPGLVRPIPMEPDARAYASAVLADAADVAGTASRVAAAREIVAEHFSYDRFASEWRSLLLDASGFAGRPKPPPDPKFERQRQLVRDCPHRGEELIKGCNCKFRCRANKGHKLTPDVVTLAECYECAKVAMEA